MLHVTYYYRRSSVVTVSLFTLLSPAKMAEPIDRSIDSGCAIGTVYQLGYQMPTESGNFGGCLAH